MIMTEKQTVTKQIKELLKSSWRDYIKKELMSKRDSCVLNIIQTSGCEDKIYSRADEMRFRIKFLNDLIKLEDKVVEVEEDVEISELLKEWDDLDVGSPNDLFANQE